VQVELVNVQTSDGVRLDGALARASGSARLGLDLMIFHHGVGGHFYGPSMAAALTERFVAEGCSLLLVNSRGHDLAYTFPTSPKGPLGAAFEIVDEFRVDSRAWLDFAVSGGFRRIGLWGHSLGAVKVIYSLAVEEDPRVVCAIASSPPRLHYESALIGEHEETLASIARANELLAAGKPEELVSFDELPSMSARTVMDKYGPTDRYDFFAHLPNVRVPLLLTIGGLENGLRFDALAKEGPSLADAQANLTFASVDDADHSYMGRIPEVWALTRTWLESTKPRT
jgi:hypothetical protein